MRVTLMEYRRTLTTKMVNSLKGQKNRGSISIFARGAVLDSPGGGGGGGALRYRGGPHLSYVFRGGRGGGALRYRGGPHLSYIFRGGRGLFLRPPHVRDFVKKGYFFVPRYEVWGSKSPYNPRNICGSDAE